MALHIHSNWNSSVQDCTVQNVSRVHSCSEETAWIEVISGTGGVLCVIADLSHDTRIVRVHLLG